MTTISVYGLYRDGDVRFGLRYIGKSVRPLVRFKQHMRCGMKMKRVAMMEQKNAQA
jgi:hypothetical protein